MRLSSSLLVIVCLSCWPSSSWSSSVDESRDLFASASSLFSDLRSRVSSLQSAAAADFESRIKPWLQSNVAPAVSQAGDELGRVGGELGRVVSDAGGQIERVGGELGRVVSDAGGQIGATVKDVSDDVGAYVDEKVLKPFRATNFNTMWGLGPLVAPWWQRENVCEQREVVDEDSDEVRENGGHHVEMSVTTCREGLHFHECTTRVNTNGMRKTLVVGHTCCLGFRRIDATSDCVAIELRSVEETLRSLGGQPFLTLMEETDLMASLQSEKLTIFMPTEKALDSFRDELESMNNVETSASDFYAVSRQRRQVVLELNREEEVNRALALLISNHLVRDEMITSADMVDHKVLQSDEGQVRLSVYNTLPQRTVLANCARLISFDHMVAKKENKEMVIHVVDQLVMPSKFTLAHLVQTDPQFSLFNEYAMRVGLMDKLSNVSDHLTLFVPTNEAFEELNNEFRDRLEKGESCAQDILSHHVLPNVICSSVIESEATTLSIDNKLIRLSRGADDGLQVEGVRVLRSDVVAINGVLHVIKSVLRPKSARSLRSTLMERGASTFVALMDKANLLEKEEFFDNKTLFVPSDKAFAQLPHEVMEEFNEDKEKLKHFLLYHVTQPEMCKCDFANNKKVNTLVEDKSLTLNVYTSSSSLVNIFSNNMATVQCVAITDLDDEACGSIVHGLDKVLLPPTGSVLEILRYDGSFTKLLKLIEVADMESELESHGSFTLFAPNDEAFGLLVQKEHDKMFKETEEAAKVLRHHLTKHQVCCAGIPMDAVSLINPVHNGHRMMDHKIVQLRRSHTGHLFADKAEILVCDQVASNGVVHTIDRVISHDQHHFVEKSFNIWKVFQ